MEARRGVALTLELMMINPEVKSPYFAGAIP